MDAARRGRRSGCLIFVTLLVPIAVHAHKRIGLREAMQRTQRAFISKGVPKQTAYLVASMLVRGGDRDGIPTHGIASRLRDYLAEVETAKVNKDAVPVVMHLKPSTFFVDAKEGFAAPALKRGIDAAKKAVRKQGVVGVTIANSHHFGVGGYHLEQVAKQGLIGILVGNSAAAVAPYGGTKPVFGTNPIVAAFPSSKGPPLILDVSTSRMTQGSLKDAAEKGTEIPPGTALDNEGNLTTDAAKAMNGAILSMGDHRGMVLSMFVELLAAGLSRSNLAFQSSPMYDPQAPPPRWGQTLILIDPKAFGADDFGTRTVELLSEILKQEGTRIPGRRRLEARKRAYRKGIEIPNDVYELLMQPLVPTQR